MSAADSPPTASTVRVLAPLKPTTTDTPMSSNPQVPSLIQKTWIIPPRPKPGRKPATDTPASKRKAQNRVAQRAFRERKAAKVGELEDQMTQMSKDHEAEVRELQDQLGTLSSRLDQQLSGNVHVYDQAIRELQEELDVWKQNYAYERKLRENFEKELAILKGEAVSLPRRAHRERGVMQPQSEVPDAFANSKAASEDMSLGCGRCSLSHCQCLAEVLNDTSMASTSKRSVSPSNAEQPWEKKSKSLNGEAARVEQSDIQVDPDSSTDMIPDRCGFCTDGSTCLCAELAAERQRTLTQPSSLPSPPVEDYSQSLAEPTEIDFTHLAPSKPCPTGPGTCNQCRNDPSSKGFCKGLAAMHSSGSPAQSSGGTISCASAFNQLKQHPAFNQASKNYQEWLPRLATVPKGGVQRGIDHSRPAYTAFEIESASVLGVLKFFDRKFGMDS